MATRCLTGSKVIVGFCTHEMLSEIYLELIMWNNKFLQAGIKCFWNYFLGNIACKRQSCSKIELTGTYVIFHISLTLLLSILHLLRILLVSWMPQNSYLRIFFSCRFSRQHFDLLRHHQNLFLSLYSIVAL